MRSDILRVHAALMSVSLIYGYFYVAVKLLLNTISPSEFILLRFILTAVVVIAIERLFRRKPFPRGPALIPVIGWGLIGVFLVQILVVWGLSFTTAFHSALIMAAVPIITLLFSILIGRETFHIQKLAGILIGFAGVSILLFFTKSPETPLPETYLLGDFIVLLNAIAFSLFLLASQTILKEYNSFSFMAYCYIFSAILFSTLFFGNSLSTDGSMGLAFLTNLSWENWALIGYVVLFASIGSYTLNNFALRRVSPSVVALYIFIQPVISALTGFYFLNEPFNWQMALATVVTFAGVMLATSANDKGVYLRKSAPAPETKETRAPHLPAGKP